MQSSFHLGFNSREAANIAAGTLRADGYEVGFQPQPDDRSVVINASPTVMPSVEEIAAIRLRMEALARGLGGEFLGHSGSEQQVLPDPLR